MNRSVDKILGYLVWRGAKWYLRRRLPSTRTVALAGFAGISLVVVAALFARRLGN